ncbi:uncharacterized protein UDID_18848 [Ustilago sp. UG-2017a]|nr:uncharacterized protein UDID_18848 [Ustilago sp. UG-2017a]
MAVFRIQKFGPQAATCSRSLVSAVACLRPGSGEVAQHDQYQYKGDGEVGGVNEDTKVWYCSGLLPSVLSISGPLVYYEPPSDVKWMRIHSTSDDEKRVPFFVEYCTGGPSSTTPVLLELCVDPFDTAPPPPDLFAGLLYTAPPPSTGNGSSGSYLPSP